MPAPQADAASGAGPGSISDSISGQQTVSQSASPALSTVHPHTPTVSTWVQRWAGVIRPCGSVLDLACGGGRHARFLAARGHAVEAVDRDAAALATLSAVTGISTRCADLEGGAWPYAGRSFDAIVVSNYLHRPLLPLIAATLAPGAVLIYETFRAGNESYGKPSNSAFLLQPGELLAFAQGADLQIIGFEDGFRAQPSPAMIQRICAARPPLPAAAQALPEWLPALLPAMVPT